MTQVGHLHGQPDARSGGYNIIDSRGGLRYLPPPTSSDSAGSSALKPVTFASLVTETRIRQCLDFPNALNTLVNERTRVVSGTGREQPIRFKVCGRKEGKSTARQKRGLLRRSVSNISTRPGVLPVRRSRLRHQNPFQASWTIAPY